MREFLDISSISFYISLLGIVSMLSFKSWEMKSGEKSFISKFADKVNPSIHSAFYHFKKILAYFNKKTALALIQWIAYHILSWVRKIYIKMRELAHMHPPSKKVLDMVRGKGEANKNGGSSIYLKIISEESVEEVLK